MESTKKLGVWMDHSIAHLIEFTPNSFEIKTIESEFIHLDKKQDLAKNESLVRNKDQQKLSNYYKKLGDIIKDYERVLLFGPTDAKVELLDVLSKDERFIKIEIGIKSADKMNDNQKNSFVRSYFSMS